MSWADVLPRDLAKRQEAWERRMLVWRTRQRGLTLRAIGDGLGISPCRVAQIIKRVERDNERQSPIEQYFAQRPFYNAYHGIRSNFHERDVLRRRGMATRHNI